MSDQKRIAFGYNRDGHNRIVIHPLQSQAVRLIFELYADGQSLEKISSQFFACGIHGGDQHRIESCLEKVLCT